ncbi:MAG: D-alanine--D-alanine ligase, partial [Gammaproteobacteria bacterium]
IGIVQEQVLPTIKLETRREFYDYEAKYLDDQTSYICPCGLQQDAEQRLGELAMQAFQLVHASGWGRVDIMLDDDDVPFLIEVNTVPGMTDHSLVPMAAKQLGVEFDELVVRILDTSFARGAVAVQTKGAA